MDVIEDDKIITPQVSGPLPTNMERGEQNYRSAENEPFTGTVLDSSDPLHERQIITTLEKSSDKKNSSQKGKFAKAAVVVAAGVLSFGAEVNSVKADNLKAPEASVNASLTLEVQNQEIPTATATPTQERNVRNRPSTEKTDVVGTVTPSEKLSVEYSMKAKDGTWYKVSDTQPDGTKIEGWVRADGVTIEGAPLDLTDAGYLVFQNGDGSFSDKWLADTSTSVSDLLFLEQNLSAIKEANILPVETFNPGNLGIVSYDSQTGKTAFVQRTDIRVDASKKNEAGTLLTLTPNNGSLSFSLFGPGQTADVLRAQGINVPDNAYFSAEGLPEGYVTFGGVIFDWSNANTLLNGGVPAENAVNLSTIEIEGGSLPTGVKLDIQGDNVDFGGGLTAQITTENGVRKLVMPQEIVASEQSLENINMIAPDLPIGRLDINDPAVVDKLMPLRGFEVAFVQKRDGDVVGQYLVPEGPLQVENLDGLMDVATLKQAQYSENGVIIGWQDVRVVINRFDAGCPSATTLVQNTVEGFIHQASESTVKSEVLVPGSTVIIFSPDFTGREWQGTVCPGSMKLFVENQDILSPGPIIYKGR